MNKIFADTGWQDCFYWQTEDCCLSHMLQKRHSEMQHQHLPRLLRRKEVKKKAGCLHGCKFVIA